MGFVVELVVTLILGGLAYWWYFYVVKFRNKLQWIPHVPGLPLLGIALEFIGGTTVFLDVIGGFLKQYGKIITVDIGTRRMLLVSDYKFLEFLLSSTKIITKSNDYSRLRPWLGTGLLTSTGAKWKKRRRIITPAFHFSILDNFIEIFESKANVLVNKLEKEVGKDSVDIYPYITLCSLDAICETAMGTSINAQNNESKEYVTSVKRMCVLFIERAFSAAKMHDILYRFTPSYYEEKRLLKILHSHTISVIDLRRKQLMAKSSKKIDADIGIKEKKVFLDILLESTVDGQPLSDEGVREEVDTFMFEGHDTTSSSESFCLWALSNHPDIQQKVLNEQHEIFGDFKDVYITHKDLNNMKYLEAVIKEALRLYPSVPFFGRMVDEDIEYEEGKVLPKGLDITVMAFDIHKDPEYFPEPDKFQPERFLEIDGKLPYAYIPFSAGARNCIGQKFAMLLMKTIISKIIQNYELLPTSPKHEVILSAETVLKSKNGMRMRLKRRT